MTPGARLSAAIDVLDRILGGSAVEQALTNWGRASRYAGSGDRAAVRDLVFDALRCRRSFAALGGGETGRGLILGGIRDKGGDEGLFSGEGHAPLTSGADDGAETDSVLRALRQRAPVFLRVNQSRADAAQAIDALAADGVIAGRVNDMSFALEVTANARKIQNSAAYTSGLVELQDASSQAIIEALPLRTGLRVLDYCAGGGGKTLAMAAVLKGPVDAHDIAPQRMSDLPLRAARAGAIVNLVTRPQGPYDLVLADAPCSGSGSWRRDPIGKWALSPEKLARLQDMQAEVMDQAASFVGETGVFAYATCSLLRSENQAQVAAFLARHSGWTQLSARQWTPLSGGDGFFLSMLTRKVS
jgi:16S rRNA (cytosine967-C5)-methyltransferase